MTASASVKSAIIAWDLGNCRQLHADPISSYRLRNGIERAFGRLKINRAIATRYDKLASSFLGMLHLASIKFWLRFVHTA